MSDDTPGSVEAPVKQRRGRPPGSGRKRQANHGPDREPKGRAERIPLGAPRLKLTADKIPGFETRWINHQGARVQQAIQGGYYYVDSGEVTALTTDPGDSCISQVVGTKENGEPMRAYLMKIPSKWYREDQDAKKQRRDETMAQIERGVDEKGGPGQDGRYVPPWANNRLR